MTIFTILLFISVVWIIIGFCLGGEDVIFRLGEGWKINFFIYLLYGPIAVLINLFVVICFKHLIWILDDLPKKVRETAKKIK